MPDKATEKRIRGLTTLPESAAGRYQKTGVDFGYRPSGAETQRDIALDKKFAPIERAIFMETRRDSKKEMALERSRKGKAASKSTPPGVGMGKGLQILLESVKWNLGGREGPGPRDKGYKGSPDIGTSLRKLIMPEKAIPPDPFDVEANAAQAVSYADIIPEYVERKTGSQLAGLAAGLLTPSPVTDKAMKIIKDKGGNWLPGSTPDRLKTTHPGEGPSHVAETKFYNEKVLPYIKNRMGTKDDEILLALERGEAPLSGESLNRNQHFDPDSYAVKSARQKAGMPEEGIAKTEQGRAYEATTDSIIEVMDVKKIKQIRADARAGKVGLYKSGAEYDLYVDFKRDPEGANKRLGWIDNAPDETKVYNIRGVPTPVRDIQDALKMGLDSGEFDIEDVVSGKISFERAIKYAGEVQEKARRGSKRLLEYSVEDSPEVFVKGKKFHVKELKHPGEFATESDMMSNSVRGYEPLEGMEEYIPGLTKGGYSQYGAMGRGWEDIKDGDVKIFSIRDNTTKKSLVTIELEPIQLRNADGSTSSMAWRVAQARGPSNKNISEAQQKVVDNFVKKFNEEGPKPKPVNRLYDPSDYDVDEGDIGDWAEEMVVQPEFRQLPAAPIVHAPPTLTAPENVQLTMMRNSLERTVDDLRGDPNPNLQAIGEEIAYLKGQIDLTRNFLRENPGAQVAINGHDRSSVEYKTQRIEDLLRASFAPDTDWARMLIEDDIPF